MYIWKNKKIRLGNHEDASKVIGVSRQWLSKICNSKVKISKTLAYCIVKYIDSESEILDYFEYVEKGE